MLQTQNSCFGQKIGPLNFYLGRYCTLGNILSITFLLSFTFYTFAIRFTKGRVAERLGRGLQNLVQRFESARDLYNSIPIWGAFFVLTHITDPSHKSSHFSHSQLIDWALSSK